MSEFIRNRFPINMQTEMTIKKDQQLYGNQFETDQLNKDSVKIPKPLNLKSLQTDTIQQCFMNAFRRTNNDIKHQTFNSLLSGSTLTSIMLDKNHLYCANVGDSRAVLYFRKKHSEYSFLMPTNSPQVQENYSTPSSKPSTSQKSLHLEISLNRNKHQRMFKLTPQPDDHIKADSPLSSPSHSFNILTLTQEHKPDLPKEMERIHKLSGVIKPITNKSTG